MPARDASRSGRSFINVQLKGESLDITTMISGKVAKLYELGFFDTCIREACVQLEHEIKKAVGLNKYGDRLTNAFVEYLRKKNAILESSVRTFQQEIRSLFKMIRNDFMHNLADADDTSALVALVRVARVRSMIRIGDGGGLSTVVKSDSKMSRKRKVKGAKRNSQS